MVVIAVSLAVVAASFGSLYVLSSTQQTCTLGSPIAKEKLATPVILVNAPFLGYAVSGVDLSAGPAYRFSSGSLTIVNYPNGLSPGGTFFTTLGVTAGLEAGHFWPTGYLYSPGNWTIYTVHNQTVRVHPWNTNVYRACTAPFVAEEAGVLSQHLGNGNLNVTQNSSDEGESSVPWLPFSHFSPVQVHVGFEESNYPTVDTCSTPGVTLSTTHPVNVPISVPFVYNGTNRSVAGDLEWNESQSDPPFQFISLTYDFPGYTGIWQIDSLAGNGTLGFLSFNFEPCSGNASGSPGFLRPG